MLLHLEVSSLLGLNALHALDEPLILRLQQVSPEAHINFCGSLVVDLDLLSFLDVCIDEI